MNKVSTFIFLVALILSGRPDIEASSGTSLMEQKLKRLVTELERVSKSCAKNENDKVCKERMKALKDQITELSQKIAEVKKEEEALSKANIRGKVKDVIVNSVIINRLNNVQNASNIPPNSQTTNNNGTTATPTTSSSYVTTSTTTGSYGSSTFNPENLNVFSKENVQEEARMPTAEDFTIKVHKEIEPSGKLVLDLKKLKEGWEQLGIVFENIPVPNTMPHVVSLSKYYLKGKDAFDPQFMIVELKDKIIISLRNFSHKKRIRKKDLKLFTDIFVSPFEQDIDLKSVKKAIEQLDVRSAEPGRFPASVANEIKENEHSFFVNSVRDTEDNTKLELRMEFVKEN